MAWPQSGPSYPSAHAQSFGATHSPCPVTQPCVQIAVEHRLSPHPGSQSQCDRRVSMLHVPWIHPGTLGASGNGHFGWLQSSPVQPLWHEHVERVPAECGSRIQSPLRQPCGQKRVPHPSPFQSAKHLQVPLPPVVPAPSQLPCPLQAIAGPFPPAGETTPGHAVQFAPKYAPWHVLHDPTGSNPGGSQTQDLGGHVAG
jgi:hypothetical protein